MNNDGFVAGMSAMFLPFFPLWLGGGDGCRFIMKIRKIMFWHNLSLIMHHWQGFVNEVIFAQMFYI